MPSLHLSCHLFPSICHPVSWFILLFWLISCTNISFSNSKLLLFTLPLFPSPCYSRWHNFPTTPTISDRSHWNLLSSFLWTSIQQFSLKASLINSPHTYLARLARVQEVCMWMPHHLAGPDYKAVTRPADGQCSQTSTSASCFTSTDNKTRHSKQTWAHFFFWHLVRVTFADCFVELLVCVVTMWASEAPVSK